MAGIQTLDGSLALLMEVGAAEVWRRIEANQRAVGGRFEEAGIRDCLAAREGERSGIVAFRKAGLEAEACMKKLAGEEIYISARRGWLRAAPHFYHAGGTNRAAAGRAGTDESDCGLRIADWRADEDVRVPGSAEGGVMDKMVEVDGMDRMDE